jgi:hypothetical protein
MCLHKLREDYNLLITRFVMHFTALKIISTNVLSHSRTASYYSIILVNYLSQVSLFLLISLLSLVLPNTDISYTLQISFLSAILHTSTPLFTGIHCTPLTLVPLVLPLTLVCLVLADTGIPSTPLHWYPLYSLTLASVVLPLILVCLVLPCTGIS